MASLFTVLRPTGRVVCYGVKPVLLALRPVRPPRPGRGVTRAPVRAALAQRDGPECCWCGRWCRSTDMTIEHLLPRALGGTDALENLALACAACNNARGAELGPPAGIVPEGWAALAWREGTAWWAMAAVLP
jgi:5-methylcytosine-specific restriction endonuclease McrA